MEQKDFLPELSPNKRTLYIAYLKWIVLCGLFEILCGMILILTGIIELFTGTDDTFSKSDRLIMGSISIISGLILTISSKSSICRRRKWFFISIIFSGLLFGSFGCFVWCCIEAYQLTIVKDKLELFYNNSAEFSPNLGLFLLITAAIFYFIIGVLAVISFILLYRNLFSVEFIYEGKRYPKQPDEL